ncbi:MAG: hypothetical protein ACYTEL_19465 [Planctomycetota bacterium]
MKGLSGYSKLDYPLRRQVFSFQLFGRFLEDLRDYRRQTWRDGWVDGARRTPEDRTGAQRVGMCAGATNTNWN